MRSQFVGKAITAVLCSLVLAGCGGGGLGTGTTTGTTTGGTTTGGTTTGGGTGSTCASISILTSSAQLPSAASDASSGVTISALCKDAGNNIIAGTIGFASSAGALSSTSAGETNASAVKLFTAGDPANQTIIVEASSGAVTAKIDVIETGTTVQVTGANTVGAGATVTLNAKLSDSSGNGLPNQKIDLTSSLGNTLTPASVTTDTNGQASFTYTGTHGGSDTITATSATVNASSVFPVTVSTSTLTFQAPAANTNIPFNTPQTVSVQYIKSGAAVMGTAIAFSTNRGTLSATSATTDVHGVASVSISSDGSSGAGGATITAQAAAGPSATLPVEFVSTTPNSVMISASPTTIAPNSTSTVTAVVLDASDNPVFGQTVDFALTDVTGGSLSAGSGVTDLTGSTSVTYKASSKTSGGQGVKIGATVRGTAITTPTAPTDKRALITVSGKALFVTLGTGNTISALNDTQYQQPYSVTVKDSAGNAVPSAVVNISIQSIAYQKGDYGAFDTTDGIWTQDAKKDGGAGALILPGDKHFNNADLLPFGCVTEDANNNGILDTQGGTTEDYNGNGILEPGNVATVPATVTLDATGSAQFEITYPKDHGNWTEVRLTAIATVAGSETTAMVDFILPVLASDLTSKTVSPPGYFSPYGLHDTCAVAN